MYLRTMIYKNSGRKYLAIYESYRDENKKPKSHLVEKIGYLDESQNQYDDPISHFKNVAKEMTERAKQEKNVTITIDMDETIDSEANLFNVGYLPIKHLFIETGLNDFLFKSKKKQMLIFL